MQQRLALRIRVGEKPRLAAHFQHAPERRLPRATRRAGGGGEDASAAAGQQRARRTRGSLARRPKSAATAGGAPASAARLGAASAASGATDITTSNGTFVVTVPIRTAFFFGVGGVARWPLTAEGRRLWRRRL